MQRITLRTFAVLAIILALVLTITRLTRQDADEETSQLSSQSTSDSFRTAAEADRKARTSSRSAVPGAGLDSRALQLIDLKKRWIRIGEHPPGLNSKDDSMYRAELSKESARLLLCSVEAIELIQFLRKEGILNTVETQIKALFESDLAGEARQTLVSLPDETSVDGTNYRQLWSGPAGKGCPPEQFREFCSTLGDPVSVQEAVFGHNVAMVQTDPIGALTSTLRQIETGVASQTKSSSVRSLIQALPPGTDFEQVEKLLSTFGSDDQDSPFLGFRSGLVRVWAESDPAAAANYLMEHPDRFPTSNITIPAMAALARDLTTGIEWIQSLPDGPYFDAAADVAVTRLRQRGNSKEAHELASQIGDPATRRETMESALMPPRRYSESD